MKRITFIFLVLISLTACKKEESKMWTEVNVTATNFNTGEPLNDVFISIVENKSGILGANSDPIYESFTDENGLFYYGWKAKKNDAVDYQLIAQADPQKYKQVEFQQINYLTKGNSHNIEFELVEFGGLNIDFINSNCFDQNDELRFRYYFKKSPQSPTYIYVYSFYWDNDLTLDGCQYLTGDGEYQPLPSGTYTVEWNVTRGSGYSQGSDQIVVPEGDTVTYVLEY